MTCKHLRELVETCRRNGVKLSSSDLISSMSMGDTEHVCDFPPHPTNTASAMRFNASKTAIVNLKRTG